MSKRVIIVHCWEGLPNYCWYPQVKKELEEKGFQAEVPEMPETASPKLFGWLSKLKEVISTPDEGLYLVGHSLGCITIMRYLESLEDSQKIGGVVFVAGFTDDLGYEELKNFFETEIDFEKVKKKGKKFMAIHSDNDPYVDLKYGEIFKEKLKAEVIVLNNKGHFSGPVDNKKSCIILPEITESILQISNG